MLTPSRFQPRGDATRRYLEEQTKKDRGYAKPRPPPFNFSYIFSAGVSADCWAGTSQLNAAIDAVHSSSLAAFLARKLMPKVPNFSALPACGASLKTSLCQVISNPT